MPVFIEPPNVEDQTLFYDLGMDKYWEVHFRDSLQFDSILLALRGDPQVLIVDTIFFGEAALEPLDFGYPLQWYHNQANDIDLDSPEAWDFDTN